MLHFLLNKKMIHLHALYDLAQPASAVHNYNSRYTTNQNLRRPFSRTN